MCRILGRVERPLGEVAVAVLETVGKDFRIDHHTVVDDGQGETADAAAQLLRPEAVDDLCADPVDVAVGGVEQVLSVG